VYPLPGSLGYGLCQQYSINGGRKSSRTTFGEYRVPGSPFLDPVKQLPAIHAGKCKMRE